MNSAKNSEKRSVQPLIIAVDGYSSCGKSTFAKMIARELNFVYIDSGAMYRAVTLYSLENNMISGQNINIEELLKSLHRLEIRFTIDPSSGKQETWLNGRNVENEIRGIEVSQMVSKISRIKEVRSNMVALQRLLGSGGKVVMDGRDIGSTVFPGATFKIFMKADAKVRAERRYKELSEKGIKVEFDEILNNILMRDYEDETREESPLRKAHDAVILDNSHMTVEEQMLWFRQKWEAILKNHDN